MRFLSLRWMARWQHSGVRHIAIEVAEQALFVSVHLWSVWTLLNALERNRSGSVVIQTQGFSGPAV
jgi:hypothetical protein